MQLNDLPLGMPPGARSVSVQGVRQGRHFSATDSVAEEVPVALEFNGISHAVMLASPVDLEDFAIGFAITEGIVDRLEEVHDLELVATEKGMTVRFTIAAGRFAALKERRRSLAGRTGCGLCGVESLDQVCRPIATIGPVGRFAVNAVLRAVAALRDGQALHAATGATHAAGWSRADGHLLVVREDVGRHNALDKLAGALAQARLPAAEGFVVVTSRASMEMVSKTARLGVGLLAAVSGVTSLAVDLADQAGLTLMGFARGQDVGVYAHADRLRWEVADGL